MATALFSSDPESDQSLGLKVRGPLISQKGMGFIHGAQRDVQTTEIWGKQAFWGVIKSNRTGPQNSSKNALSSSTLNVQLRHCSSFVYAVVCNSLQERSVLKGLSSAHLTERLVHNVIERGPRIHKKRKPLAGPTDMICRSRRMSPTAAADSYRPAFSVLVGMSQFFNPSFLAKSGRIFGAMPRRLQVASLVLPYIQKRT